MSQRSNPRSIDPLVMAGLVPASTFSISVIAGLVPAIHVASQRSSPRILLGRVMVPGLSPRMIHEAPQAITVARILDLRLIMDARVKPAHDELSAILANVRNWPQRIGLFAG